MGVTHIMGAIDPYTITQVYLFKPGYLMIILSHSFSQPLIIYPPTYYF